MAGAEKHTQKHTFLGMFFEQVCFFSTYKDGLMPPLEGLYQGIGWASREGIPRDPS